MRGLNALLVWAMVVVFATAGFILLFYTAALLLPIILGIFAFSLIAGWFKRAQMPKRADTVKDFYRNAEVVQKESVKSKKRPTVIDAEYEIVDEKDRKN